MNKNAEGKMIRRFLLGLENEDEAETIGQRIIGDEGFDATMAAAEESLVEEFLDGGLKGAELEAFKTNFLASSRRAGLVGEIAALREAARRGKSPETSAAFAAPTFGERLAAFFGGRRLAFGFGALALVLAAGLAFALLRGDGLSPLEREYAAINSKGLQNSPETAGLTTKALFPEVFRGGSGPAAFRLAESTDRVLFRLELPVSEAAGGEAKRDIEIVSGGVVIFRQPGVPVLTTPGGAEIDVVVPRSVLRPGELTIRAGRRTSYTFRAE